MEGELPQTTQTIMLEQQKKEQQTQTIGFCQIFRFANTTDYILMICGSLCACAMGTAIPAFALLWGNMTNSFGNSTSMVDAAKEVMLDFIYIGIAAVFAGWGMFGCWMIAGERQGIACRKEYLRSLLKQQIGWFDTINQSQLASKFATDSFAFQGAIGQKVSTIIMTIAMFVAGSVIAFIKGWLMTLVIVSTFPLLLFSGYLYASAISNKDKQQEQEYAEAGGQAQQAIAAIKTVKQLNGEQFQSLNYAQTLKDVTKKSLKYGIFLGIGLGALFFCMLSSYSLGFWYGSHCVQNTDSCPARLNGGEPYTAGNVLTVFFSIVMAGFNLSQLTPAIKKITEGRAAAARIYKIIDRQPQIKSPLNAVRPNNVKGIFKFNQVTFAYPKDKSRNILQNFTIQINCQSVAFVGDSGCGKSTIFQLMMRFYDPDSGSISLDGIDLKQLDLYWLRDQIGYVGQEPVLFASSLRENLLFGKENANDQEIYQALKKAEAFDFVNHLKQKLDTYVGVGGGQVSGGQKQRIAIARAILKNPKILLLDQATSALDKRNERMIQNTLNKISEQKMTITIAHRVTTIVNCDDIFVVERGKVIQHGKFQTLKRYVDAKYEQKQQEHAKLEEHEMEIHSKSKNLNIMTTEEEEIPQNIQTLNKQEMQKKEQQELVKKYQDTIFGRLFTYCSDQKLLFAFGVLVTMINGGIFPVFSIFLSKMLAVLVKFTDDPVQARKDANVYALIFLILGIISFFINIIEMSVFSIIGQNMTQKIRNQTYLKILKMPVPWFDKPKNSSGALAARLASDCQTVNGLITTYIAILIQNITTLGVGIIVAFVFEWRTSLVALGLIPFMIMAGMIHMAFNTGFSAKTDAAYKDSSNLISEAMINIRTVTSFGSEDMIERKYSGRLKDPLVIGIKKGNISGILYGLSQFIMFIVCALIFYLGTIFIRDNSLDIADVFTAIYSIMFAGMTAGNNSHFMPDVAAGRNSASNIFQILDGVDEDQMQIRDGSKMLKSEIKGHIQVKQVDFKYETRDQYVFKNISIEIREGDKIGFVGASGCGKSTIYQMLQRFYQPSKGTILIDGVNIKDYDIHYLRSCLGVVSQEPTLFNTTIGKNIRYNKIDASHQEIVSAANQSNFNPEIHQIQDVQELAGEKRNKQKKKDDNLKQIQKHKIVSTGVGFDKNVGPKGSHISGGQKQRVAIARVILREPKVLLLDEATSALDEKNEKAVQQSLDRIMKDKTTVNIAHKLNTIKNANKIMVFEKGIIVQVGTYNQLIAKNGYFYKLQRGLEFV